MNSELQRAEPRAVDRSPSEAAKPRSSGRMYTPRVDVVETEDALILHADLPGVKQEDVSLTCKGEEMILHATCVPRNAGKKRLYAEYDVGSFYRAFKIAEQVDTGAIEASLKDGVLTVRVPKAEAVRPKRIAVTGR
ncbi:Heat shock protein Hsp20 OS=Rhodopirellula europaea SH398 GN=RESH_01705 PE=3 SV=1: HSP20 [Gemmata massiliana]|uniref:SHSP domain-containing protein n=1 Tax=Gemmata massiliana TaxID=1210884 RepID=A0A6P2CSP9_9BACT|nr:Hsp20/alpha crystallin family protein [Gemmata massiliana]VTR91637.1 Heat shock protein Hsp20 OS=Rhodopirellula europaea SH398 GN=RESH_01705 PE=3 SV=1: HSP20 [Gemmata massiliana]